MGWAALDRLRRLRLRHRASMLVLTAAVVIGALVTFILVLEHLDTEAAAAEDAARSAQFSLDGFSLAASGERVELQDYVLTREPAELAAYRDRRAVAAQAEADLRTRAGQDGVDLAALDEAATAWQAWADATVARPPPPGSTSGFGEGEALFGRLQQREGELDAQLGSLASGASIQADWRAAYLAIVTPAVGGLLLLLLLVLWWLVVSSMLRPIDRLSATARGISRGDATEIPGLRRPDELGHLARALAAWRREATYRLDLANAVATEKEQQARTLELLNEAATAVGGVLEPAVLTRILVAKASALVSGAHALLGWYEPDRDVLVLVVMQNGDRAPAEVGTDDGGLLGHVFRTGAAMLIKDYQGWPDGSELARQANVQCMAAVPLAIGDERAGVLAVYTSAGERMLDEHDLQLLALLAVQTAPAVEAARLHAELVGAHAEVRRTNEELTHANERLAGANEELERTNQDLAAASRHKSDFLASMSHELRTPLNAILGFSELILDRDDIDVERRAGFLRHINTSGRHLLGLINDMLDLAKVEAGQMEVRIQRFDASETVAAAVSTMEPLATKRMQTLSADCPSPLPVEADEDKVRQILLNLLSNAVKFTPEGGTVRVEAVSEPTRVVLAVIDTGVGIPPDEHEHIFEEFRQLDNGGAMRRQGTGLGLALVRRLVELQGGSVWVESEPGQGSRFSIALPAGAAAGAAVARDRALDGAPAVLVVEPDAAAAAMVADALRGAGYRPLLVRDGGRAVVEAARSQPVAVLVDARAEGPDGWEVVCRLKSSERTRHVPAVLFTTLESRRAALAIAAEDYLAKPVDRAALARAMGRLWPADASPCVLVIDDERQALTRLARQLEPACTLISATTGAEGLAIVRERDVDVVLLAQALPDLAAVEVIAALADDGRTRGIPVLAMVAPAREGEDRERLTQSALAVLERGGAGSVDLLERLRRLPQARGPRASRSVPEAVTS